ncbi:MAG: helix-turn-helix domain-containing protein [Candidatus Woesearchaeota archaeon]
MTWFKTLLKEKNISGYQLSILTGIPQSTISRLSNDYIQLSNMSLENVLVICSNINMDIYELLQYREEYRNKYFELLNKDC